MNANQRTILIVDDDQDILDTIGIILESEGYIILKAMNASEAVRLLSANAGQVPVMILDREMPGTKGDELSKIIKQNERFKHTQIIMQTGMNKDEDVVDGLASGADYYLTKPYDANILISMIETCLRRYDELVTNKQQVSLLQSRIKTLNDLFKILDEQTEDPSPFALLSKLRNHMRDILGVPGNPEIRQAGEEETIGIIEKENELIVCYPPFTALVERDITEEQRNHVIQMLAIMSKHLQIKTQEAINRRLQTRLKNMIDTAGATTLDLVKEIDEAGDDMSRELILQKIKINLVELLVVSGHDHLKPDLDRLKAGAMSNDVNAQSQSNVDDLLSQFGL